MVSTPQLIAALSQQAAPIRPRSPGLYMALLLTGMALCTLATLWWLGIRPDLGTQMLRPWFIAEVGLLGCIWLSAGTACVLAMYPDHYQRAGLLKLPYLFVGLLIATVLVQLSMPASADMVMPDHTAHTFECTLFIALASLPPAAIIFVLLRKGATVTPRYAGMLAVIAASSVGMLALRLGEANDAITHVLFTHYLPSIASTALGAWIGHRLLRW